MPDLVPVLRKDEIQRIVGEMGQKISSDYQGRELILIGILNGAFIFLSDLIRQLTIPVKVDFIRAASYGSDTSTSGKIQLTKGIEIDIRDKDVMVVEDIVDTGLTLNHILDYVKSLGPHSVRVCALLDKTERRQTSIALDYAGFKVPEGFLVGYGLDYAEDYRNLPAIYHLQP